MTYTVQTYVGCLMCMLFTLQLCSGPFRFSEPCCCHSRLHGAFCFDLPLSCDGLFCAGQLPLPGRV